MPRATIIGNVRAGRIAEANPDYSSAQIDGWLREGSACTVEVVVIKPTGAETSLGQKTVTGAEWVKLAIAALDADDRVQVRYVSGDGMIQARCRQPASVVTTDTDPVTGRIRNIAGGTWSYPETSQAAKFRRAVASAIARNPNARLPWVAPAAWATGQVIQKGEVRANAGQWYAAHISGTTSASGSGPTSTKSGAEIADGSVKWTWLRAAPMASSDTSAPTVTVSTTNPGRAQTLHPVLWPSVYTVLGGVASPIRTNFWEIQTFAESSGVQKCRGAQVAFCTDADVFDIFLLSNAQQSRVIVIDDLGARYLTPGSIYSPGDSFMTIDWSATSGVKDRVYIVETNKSYGWFGGVRLPAYAQAWAYTPPDDVSLAWISDSFAAGADPGPWIPGNSIPQLFGRELGIGNVHNFSTGGTGYVSTGTGFYNYLQRIQDPANAARLAQMDGFVLMGSTNDTGQSAAAITANVVSTLTALRALSKTPDVPIVVFGVPSINVTDRAMIESAVASGVQQFADPHTTFIPIDGATIPWVTGSWNQSSTPSGAATNAGLYVSYDNTHPPELGNAYYAHRLAQAWRQSVLGGLF